MTHRDLHTDELFTLTERQLEGNADASDLARLNTLLAESPGNRQRYLAHLQLHGEMHWQTTDADKRLTTAPGSTLESASLKPGDALVPGRESTPDTPLSAAGAPIYRKGCEPKSKSAIGNRQSAILYSGIAAALLAACGVAIYLLAFNAPTTDEPDPSQPGPSVATLIGTSPGSTVIVNDNIGNPGEEYAAGSYSIEYGDAQFMLTNSVTVDLRGRTRLVAHNNMRSTLTRGTARFDCPPIAKGYAVHLPDDTRVIDLGTRFVVTVGEDGRSRIGVIEGVVRIVRDDTVRPIDRTLTVGEAVIVDDTELVSAHLTPGGRVVESITVDPIVFNAASNDPDQGDEPPGLAEGFEHSRLVSKDVPVEAAFGRARGPIEPGYLLFADYGAADNGNDRIGDGDEKVDHIEWRTRKPITLGGYRIDLKTDGDVQAGPRSTQMVRLVVDDHIIDTFDADGRHGTIVRLFEAGPVTGQQFRIELTRTTEAGSATGPRIAEIDAVNASHAANTAPEHLIHILPNQLDDTGIVVGNPPQQHTDPPIGSVDPQVPPTR